MEGKNETSSADNKTQFDVQDTANTLSREATQEGTSTLIYIDPEKEAAAFRKFDKYVLPVSVIFQVLSSLDRNNVSARQTHDLY